MDVFDKIEDKHTQIVINDNHSIIVLSNFEFDYLKIRLS